MHYFDQPIIITQLLKMLYFAFFGFVLAILLTPLYTTLAYKYQWWRKKRRTLTVTGAPATVMSKLHAAKHKRQVPTMGGLIVIIAVLVITLLFNLDRKETYLPLVTLILFAGLGLVDDLSNILSRSDSTGGLRAKTQLLALVGLATVCALWFYYKLGYNLIHVPALGDYSIGWLYVPLFVLAVVATAKSVSITDGLDGLAGGLLSIAYGAFAVISFFNGLYIMAIFCATVLGGMLAYTWFNIYPARFFMGQVGSTALGATLAVVALLNNAVFVLPIIGFVFVVETGSVIVQLTSKKLRGGKKVFLSSPIHHHFEATGWPETKVTMRFWIIGAMVAIIGVILGLLGSG